MIEIVTFHEVEKRIYEKTSTYNIVDDPSWMSKKKMKKKIHAFWARRKEDRVHKDELS